MRVEWKGREGKDKERKRTTVRRRRGTTGRATPYRTRARGETKVTKVVRYNT